MSEDGTKRYALKKVWDPDKPSLAIIMLAPSQAGEICLDTSSMLTINNCHRLGKGSVTIVNLFSKINDFALKEAEAEDSENIRAIVAAAESADCVVLAAGTGKQKNKTFQQRLEQVLTALRPYEAKLHCLCDKDGGSRHLHPLSPRVREWHLSPLRVCELMTTKEPQPPEKEPEKKPRGRPKATKKESKTD
jgi:hypothetical protein